MTRFQERWLARGMLFVGAWIIGAESDNATLAVIGLILVIIGSKHREREMEPREFDKEIEDSTNISLLSYSAPERCLIVTFNSGSTYEYTDVPVDVAENFLQAESVGKFFYKNIRGNYKYQRVETKDDDQKGQTGSL